MFRSSKRVWGRAAPAGAELSRRHTVVAVARILPPGGAVTVRPAHLNRTLAPADGAVPSMGMETNT
jgi:hypothetical protein